MKKEFYFYPKFYQRFCLFNLILFSITLLLLLILVFNIFFLLFLVIIVFYSFLYYYSSRNRIIIDNDRITYIGFKKKIFYINNIKEVVLLKRGHIKFILEEDKFIIFGYYEFLSNNPNYDKNNELVELINGKIKKYKKDYWYK